MAETSLRAYINQLEGVLSQGGYDEVVAHCRHILATYPKHLSTYRILGKAFLELGQHQDASDIFLRVLSIDPSDFVAHAGMSIIYEDSDALDESVWHMERAFEVSPNNEAIQEELRRLYTKRSGKEPPKIQLTRGALARLYTRGALFQQAIAELTHGITEQPDRVDLIALLAETLWKSHQKIKAGQVAAQLLERLPHCLAANRILSELWLNQGEEREAQPFLERVEDLDPYLALEIGANGQRVTPDAVTIDALDWRSAAMQTGTASAPQWADQFGEAILGDQPSVPAERPDLTAIFGESAPDVAAPAVPVPGTGEESDDDGPSWLANIATVEPAVAAEAPSEDLLDQAVQEAAPEDTPEWLSEIVGEVGETDETPAELTLPEAGIDLEDVPDWLKNIADEPVESEATAEFSDMVPTVTDTDDDVPDWLAGLGEESSPGEATVEAAPAGEDVPDWLAEVEMGSVAAPAAETAEVVEAEEEEAEPEPEPELEEPAEPLELEAWDPTEVETWEGSSEETVEEAEEDEEAVPDWLDEPSLESEEAEATPSAVASETPEEEAVPDWLEANTAAMEAAVSDSEAAPEAQAEEEVIPDWLEADTSTLAGSEAEVTEMGEQTDGEAIPDWLQMETEAASEDAEETTETEVESEELPDWLQSEETLAADSPDEDETDIEALPAGEAEAPKEVTEVAPSLAAPDGEEESPDEETPEFLESGDFDSDDAMAWLEGLAAKQGADPEEFVTGASGEETPEAAPSPEPPSPADEDDLDWLREPKEPEPEAAMPSAEAEEDVPDWLQTESETPVEAEAPAPVAEASTEADTEVPDWLLGDVEEEPEEIAAPAAESQSEGEIPDWLQVDDEPEAPVPTPLEPEETATPEAEAPPAVEADVPDWLTTIEEPVVEAEEPPPPEPAPVAEAGVPDWLTAEEEPVAEAEEPPLLEPDPVAEVEEPPPPEPAPVAEAGVPDPDSDDALAWLEELTEEQGADPEELITEQLKEEAPAPAAPPADEEVPAAEPGELPDWLRAEASAAEAAEPEPEPVVEALPVDEAEAEELDWLGEAVEPLSEEDQALAEFLQEGAGQAAEAEPASEPEPPAAPEPEPIAQAELPDWLTADEEEPEEDEALAAFLSGAEPEPEPPAAPMPPPVPEPAAPPPTPEPPPAPATPPVAPPAPPAPVSGDVAQQLATARETLATNRDAALDIYEGLIAGGESLAGVIEHLSEVVSGEASADPRARRLLGDALMADGRVQDAIETYKGALDQI